MGLAGKEGSQAALSSDYALQRFHHLQRLLLLHGRYCHLRTAALLCNAFFNNMAFIVPQIMYSSLSGYSGQVRQRGPAEK